MKLLLRRDQRSAVLGNKIVFSLDVRAELTDEERKNVERYKLADTMLFQRLPDTPPAPGVSGYLASVIRNSLNVEITVRDLAGGRKFECKNILEMLAAQESIKQASQTFKAVLEAAAQFGGEEIIEI